MYILDVSTFADACNSYVLFNILDITKKGLNIIQIIGPILTIIALTLNFIKLLVNPDEKKNTKSLINCLVATAMLFFIPFFIDITMIIIGDKTTVSECWNNVENIKQEIQNTSTTT